MMTYADVKSQAVLANKENMAECVEILCNLIEDEVFAALSADPGTMRVKCEFKEDDEDFSFLGIKVDPIELRINVENVLKKNGYKLHKDTSCTIIEEHTGKYVLVFDIDTST